MGPAKRYSISPLLSTHTRTHSSLVIVSFEVDDIEDTWPSEHSNLDYIHGRGLAGFIRDRQKLASQAFTALAPGGYYELQEQGDPMQCTDGTVPPDSVLREWVERWEDAARLIGSPWLEVSRKGALKKELEDAGFVDVEECMFIIPNGPWPKDPKLKKIGEYSLVSRDMETLGEEKAGRDGGWWVG